MIYQAKNVHAETVYMSCPEINALQKKGADGSDELYWDFQFDEDGYLDLKMVIKKPVNIKVKK